MSRVTFETDMRAYNDYWGLGAASNEAGDSEDNCKLDLDAFFEQDLL